MQKLLAKQILKLRGKTAVFIDWANVYNWKDKLKWEVDPKRLFNYLKTYEQIKEISFYFGTDVHPASKEQIRTAREIGYRVVTKTVKYLPVKDKGITVWKRKCDFDLEIGLDCFETLSKYHGFIFFTGDGDMATLYERLTKRKKQTLIIFAQGHLGKEVRVLRRGIYLCVVKKIKNFVKKISPNRRSGA
jgi:uncharacterized LabA/DUF88 family protein